MIEQRSDCTTRFGFADFDPALIVQKPMLRCPVKGCTADLTAVPYQKNTTVPWCVVHGIRLHSNTFVYWNGPSSDDRDRARLRNFFGDEKLVRDVALKPGKKVESHRLGAEMSEDALSWNVFVSLARAGRLKDVSTFLTGQILADEPALYLWGNRVDQQAAVFPPLLAFREGREAGIKNFWTEPDIMLVVHNELVVVIEAKFGSGNTLANEQATVDGAKPTAPDALIDRYLESTTAGANRDVFVREEIRHPLHSQLFRNIVFASTIESHPAWHVVNLVSESSSIDPVRVVTHLRTRRRLFVGIYAPTSRSDFRFGHGKVFITLSFAIGLTLLISIGTCAERARTLSRRLGWPNWADRERNRADAALALGPADLRQRFLQGSVVRAAPEGDSRVGAATLARCDRTALIVRDASDAASCFRTTSVTTAAASATNRARFAPGRRAVSARTYSQRSFLQAPQIMKEWATFVTTPSAVTAKKLMNINHGAAPVACGA